MKAKATLKQIAKELNVSVSTVSKALNDSPEISEQTKIRIKEYAKLKNYKPNVIGLNLKNRKTKTRSLVLFLSFLCSTSVKKTHSFSSGYFSDPMNSMCSR